MATNQAHGFASMNGGTSGGAGGRTVTVSTGSQLQAAIDSVSSSSDRLTILVSGTITPENTGADAIQIADRDNISIIGAGNSAEFDGIGLRVSGGSSNLIFRNLKIHDVDTGPKDAIGIEGPSRNIWIDHNELYSSLATSKDHFDGLLDIKRGAEYITISNNYIHDHYKASLVGFSDEDSGARYVTYDHNLFENVGSRTPSVRFGNVHIYNNYYKDVETSGINLRMGAVGLIENNVFENVHNPVVSLDSDAPGFWDLRGNVMTNVTWGKAGRGEATAESNRSTASYDVPYTYAADGATQAKAIVLANAGVGRLDADPRPSPVPGPTPNPPPVTNPNPNPPPVTDPNPSPEPSLLGSDKSDLLTGTDGDDSISGLAGHDRIAGRGGKDAINGGDGRDELNGGSGNDTLSGGNGDDVIRAGDGADVLSGDGGRDTMYGDSGADRLHGGGSPDSLFGGAGDDTLDGGTGGDRMAGNAGDDLYVVDSSEDAVVELVGEGSDTVQSSRSFTLGEHLEKLTLTGSSNLSAGGNSGDNRLIGNAGHNAITGGRGNDDMTGGAGRDLFLFTKSDIGIDVIRDFQVGEDTLKFDGFRSSEAILTKSPDGSVIRLPGGSILLQGVHVSSVSPEWAVFG